MPQSNVIFFYIFAAFVVFITLRGELPKYMGFLLASPVGPSSLGGSSFATGEPRTDKTGKVTGSDLPAAANLSSLSEYAEFAAVFV
jgi:hypothetical protein